MKCPKCHCENPDTSHFCADCGTQLPSSEDISVSHTKTIETPKEELTTGSIYAKRYQIIEELGKGGMGRVYKALDKKVNEKIALKLIKPEIASDEKTLERFSNELKVARKIVHKNVGRMYDINEEEGTHYITMEYVSGQDLKGLIRQSGQLAIGTVISIARQVCDGLAEAHRIGVVHRDLKPQNIMIDKEGNARIMDFGIARSLKGKGITGAGVMIGTPEYMSPEQVEGKEVDQRSDIYSLGVILYEMVAGRVPFEGDTPFTIGMKHKSETPKNPKEINTQIPEDLSNVILRCLEKEKEKRYQSAGELRSELDSIEKGIPTTERVLPKRKPLTSKEITLTIGMKKLFVPVLIFLAVIIGGFIILRFVLEKETALLPSEKQTIAVVSFENQTGNETYDHLKKIIPNLLITSLEQSGYFQVMTWDRMHDLLKQIGKKDVEFIDRDTGFELCRMEGIDAIVLGSFGKAGEMFATDAKVLDVSSKKLLNSASSKGEGEGSILKTQIDELSKEISRGIGVSKQKTETAQVKIADVTTTSIEAYDYYLKGLQADEKLYYDEARQFFEKAIAIDPDFTAAHFGLAIQNRDLGNTKAMNEAFAKTMSLSEKASKKERLYIVAAYSFFVDGNPEKGGRFLKQLIKEFPKEKKAHYWLAVYYDFKNLFDQAIEEYNKALDLDPDYKDVLNMIAYTYMNIKNFEKALEYFKRYASLMPEDANPIDSIAELYLHMGWLDESISKYKEALEIKPDFGSSLPIAYIYALKENYVESIKWIDQFIDMAPSPGIKADGYLWKGFYHYWLGNLKLSLEDIRYAVAMADSVGNIRKKALADWLLGWFYYDRRELELSQQHIKKWFDVYSLGRPIYKPDFAGEYNFLLGVIDLKAGKVNDAKSRLAELESLINQVHPENKEKVKFYIDYLAAELFLAEGLFEKAANACKEAAPMTFPGWQTKSYPMIHNMPFMKDTIARIYQAKGELDKAIAEYMRLITFDSDSRDKGLVHPRYHYRLARLYEQKGWKGKAIEHYVKFLSLWKDADPSFPEVEDARKRLAGLKKLP